MVYGRFGIGYGIASPGLIGMDEKGGPRLIVAGSGGFSTPGAIRCANLVFGNHALAVQGPEPQPLAHGSLAAGPHSGGLGMVMAHRDQGLSPWIGHGRFDWNGLGFVYQWRGLVASKSWARSCRGSFAIPAVLLGFGSPPGTGRP